MSTEMDLLRRSSDYAIGLAPVMGLACRMEGRGFRGLGRRKTSTITTTTTTSNNSDTTRVDAENPVIGRYCTGNSVGASCGLPYMIHGRFEMDSTSGVPHKSIASSTVLNAIKTKWNNALMEELFGSGESSLVVKMLLELKRDCTKRGVPNDLYRNWPILHGNMNEMNGSDKCTKSLIDRISTVTLYQTLSKYTLYWSNTSKT